MRQAAPSRHLREGNSISYFLMLCLKKFLFFLCLNFGISPPLENLSDQDHEARKTHISHSDGWDPDHCLLQDTQVSPGHREHLGYGRCECSDTKY